MTSNTTALVCTTASDPLLDMPVETLERKGLAHPDGICDALAEEVSVALSRYDLDQFGVLLHHNVDKVLLVSGQSRPAFGGGRVVFPYDLICAARLSESFMWAAESLFGHAVLNAIHGCSDAPTGARRMPCWIARESRTRGRSRREEPGTLSNEPD